MLFYGIITLNANEEKQAEGIPVLIRWKVQEFSKAEFKKHATELQKKAEEAEREGNSILGIPYPELVDKILRDYKEGDTIIKYDNGGWKRMTGRRGYALIRENTVKYSKLIMMN